MNIVFKGLENSDISVNTIVSIATHGAKCMTGLNKGFLSFLKSKIDHEIHYFHCTIHHEVVCAIHHEGLCAQCFLNKIS